MISQTRVGDITSLTINIKKKTTPQFFAVICIFEQNVDPMHWNGLNMSAVRVSLQLYFRVGTVHSIYNYVVNEIPLCRSNEDKIWILPDFKHAAKIKLKFRVVLIKSKNIP